MTSASRTWWKDGIVYQIWPASYKDSNGDGIGDIPGIISKLDYLKDLGVDIIWVSPVYQSPQVDMGYDISDYEDIHRPYGTVADAEALIKGCHDRGMRLLFDLVINHTSDLHPWFRESRSSKDNQKRDWYIWRPPKHNKDGSRKPPNNWRAHFGGSAWEWDETSQEYYLHLFCPEQPDLNWENEVTRNAIYESAMKFWLEKGVDGFRVDTVNMYSKGDSFPDAPVTDPDAEFEFSPNLFCNGPRMHEFLREMNSKVLSKYDCMTVGECPHTPETADVIRYVSALEKQLNMIFQFDIVDLGQGKDCKFDMVPFKLTDFKGLLDKMQRLTDGTDAWSTVFIENHDQARSISRYASDLPQYRSRSGKLLAILLATLSGTLFIYQGQEIGTINTPKTWTESDYKDVEALNYIQRIKSQHPNDAAALKEALKGIQHVGRDNARVPVQWNDSPHGGFTTGTPWMRAHDLYPEINVEQQLNDPNSVLQFWKKMLKMRKEHVDLFVHGNFELLEKESEEVVVYTKTFEGEKVLVVLNFTGEKVEMVAPDGIDRGRLKLLVGNVDQPEEGTLAPYEGRVFRVG